MRIIASMLLVFALFNINNKIMAQETDNNIYFLVDTLTIPKEQRLLKIFKSTSLTFTYEFFCSCIEPYKNNLSFFYVYNKKKPQGVISNKKPNYKYVSWQELSELIQKNKNNFDKNYNLYITEYLPGKKYMTNLVKMHKYRPPSDDGVIIKTEQ